MSLSPLVHDFPCPNNDTGTSRLHFLVVRVLSSALLPGFIGPESSVLPVDLPPSGPLPASGSPYRDRFSNVYCSLQRQVRRVSLGKTHHLPISRPTSLRFGPPDIRSRSPTPARPPPRCHIVGSLFATYTGSASCFLQTPRFQKCPCLVGVALPSGNGGHFTSGSHARRSASASCQAHVKLPAASRREFCYDLLKYSDSLVSDRQDPKDSGWTALILVKRWQLL